MSHGTWITKRMICWPSGKYREWLFFSLFHINNFVSEEYWFVFVYFANKGIYMPVLPCQKHNWFSINLGWNKFWFYTTDRVCQPISICVAVSLMDWNSHDFQAMKLTYTQIDIKRTLSVVRDWSAYIWSVYIYIYTFDFESRNWALWTG